MIFASRLAAVTLAAMMCLSVPASAQQPLPEQQPQQLPPPVRQDPILLDDERRTIASLHALR